MKKIGFCLSLVWLLLMVLTPAQADPTTTAEKKDGTYDFQHEIYHRIKVESTGEYADLVYHTQGKYEMKNGICTNIYNVAYTLDRLSYKHGAAHDVHLYAPIYEFDLEQMTITYQVQFFVGNKQTDDQWVSDPIVITGKIVDE